MTYVDAYQALNNRLNRTIIRKDLEITLSLNPFNDNITAIAKARTKATATNNAALTTVKVITFMPNGYTVANS